MQSLLKFLASSAKNTVQLNKFNASNYLLLQLQCSQAVIHSVPMTNC